MSNLPEFGDYHCGSCHHYSFPLHFAFPPSHDSSRCEKPSTGDICPLGCAARELHIYIRGILCLTVFGEKQCHLPHMPPPPALTHLTPGQSGEE